MNKNKITIDLLVGLIIPLILVSYFNGKVSDLNLLIIGGIVPAGYTVYSTVKKELNLIAIFSLLGFVLGIIVSIFLGGNAIYMKISQPIVSIIIALVLFGSVIIKKPIVYEFGKNYSGSEAQKSAIISKKEILRRPFSEMTIGIALIILLDAILHIISALNLQTAEYFAVTRALSVVNFAAIIIFVMYSIKRMKKKYIKKEADHDQI